MKKNGLNLLLFCVIIVWVSIGCTPTANSQIVVEVAEVVDVALDITDEGVLVKEAGLTIPIIETGILNVGWRTGVSWATETAQSTPNTLYVIYEDDSGTVRQNIYDIGQPFRITFRENEWTRAIERLPNGAIVVAVKVYGGGIGEEEPVLNTSGSSCPGAVPQMLSVGERAMVCTKSDNLITRDQPSGSGDELFRMAPGTRFVVIDGPVCSNDSSWWQIMVHDGTTVRYGAADAPAYKLSSDTIGWVREGSDMIDPYFICSVP